MQKKLTSVIVVNYNGRGIIGSCLEALLRQSYKAREVIVVDNNSCDGSLNSIQRIIKKHSTDSFRLVSLDQNIGFTCGNLKGLKHAKGEYIALLNNDTVPDERWLEKLVEAMDIDPKVGICASKLLVYAHDIIDSAGDGFSHALRGFKMGEGEKISLFNEKEYIFGGCAGAALYRRKMIDEIDFLDEDFFLIYEDTDLNLRAQLHGWKVLYVPTAIVHHKVRSSIGPMSNTAIYYSLRNSVLVRIKNIPFAIFLRCFPEFVMGLVTEFVYFAIKHRKFKLYFKAKIDALRMFPRMLKKRVVIMKNRKVNNKYLLSIMTSVWQRDFLVPKIKKFLHE
jgi:GT2 family glycosyltransferase